MWTRDGRATAARSKVKESWAISVPEFTPGRDETDVSQHDRASGPERRCAVPVTHPRRPPEGLERLRPLPPVLRRAGLAAAALFAPVFTALFYLTVPGGRWQAVVVALGATLVVLAAAAIAVTRAAVWVGPHGITERGVLGRLTHLPTDDIGVILLVHTFHGGGADTLAQLFLCDLDGNQVIRLRGQFWSIRDMALVCETLGIPLTELAESVTTKELLTRYPGLLYWFERHQFSAATLSGVAVLAAATLFYTGLAAIGVT